MQKSLFGKYKTTDERWDPIETSGSDAKVTLFWMLKTTELKVWDQWRQAWLLDAKHAVLHSQTQQAKSGTPRDY